MKILKKLINPTTFLLFSILCFCSDLNFHHEQTKPQSEYQLAVAKGLRAPNGMTRPNKNGAYYVFISSPSPEFYASATRGLIYWTDKTHIPFYTTENRKKANIKIIDTDRYLSNANKKTHPNRLHHHAYQIYPKMHNYQNIAKSRSKNLRYY